MSPPAQKALPAPVRMMTRTLGVGVQRLELGPQLSRMASSIALLARGRFSVSTATGPVTSRQDGHFRLAHRCSLSAQTRLRPARLMYLRSSQSSMPYFDPSRPMPDSLIPPNGACSFETRPVLTATMPASSASETRKTRPTSWV